MPYEKSNWGVAEICSERTFSFIHSVGVGGGSFLTIPMASHCQSSRKFWSFRICVSSNCQTKEPSAPLSQFKEDGVENP